LRSLRGRPRACHSVRRTCDGHDGSRHPRFGFSVRPSSLNQPHLRSRLPRWGLLVGLSVELEVYGTDDLLDAGPVSGRSQAEHHVTHKHPGQGHPGAVGQDLSPFPCYRREAAASTSATLPSAGTTGHATPSTPCVPRDRGAPRGLLSRRPGVTQTARPAAGICEDLPTPSPPRPVRSFRFHPMGLVFHCQAEVP
jgi:hypothetical protein